jgi:benzodiazapine receptor
MGYASFRVFEAGKGFSGVAAIPLIVYVLKLIANWTWSPVFFYYHLLGAALIHILVLYFLVICTGVLFYRVDRIAGYLFIPYVIWLSIASYLSARMWQLNA